MKRISLLVMTMGVLANLVYAQPEASQAQEKKLVGKPAEFIDNTFYIYKEKGDRQNHYVPGGWVGDWAGIKLDYGFPDSPHSGKNSIRVVLSTGTNPREDYWGIYWIPYAGGWGNDYSRANNLTGAKALKFWARGEKGGETIEEFRMGMNEVQGEQYPDSDRAVIGPIKLSRKWKEFKIDLNGKDLSFIPRAYGFIAKKKDNPSGMTFYLDDIRFEK